MEQNLRRSAILDAGLEGRRPGPPRAAFAALVAAGLLWGTTVPLSKVALEWLPPAWLTFARFAVAATVLLVVGWSRIKAAFGPSVLASGAIGYGGSVLLQNAGITRTSVSHAALLVGAVPVLVAVIAALWRGAVARPLAWAGFAISLAGVGIVTSGGSGGSGGGSLAGDGLVLMSVLLSAGLVAAQTQLLTSRDPVAVTAVQFLGAAAAVLPVAAFTEGCVPAVPGNLGYLLATVALAAGGTLAPFTLFAFGQSRVPAEVAGAFVNIEPVVGALAGVIIFGDPAGFAQVAGALAILAGIAMSSMPGLRRRRVAGAQPCSARSAATGQVRPPRLQRPSIGSWSVSSCCTTNQMILRYSTGTIARCTSH
jgi:O-acetylserine/cysteine efflux transporter